MAGGYTEAQAAYGGAVAEQPAEDGQREIKPTKLAIVVSHTHWDREWYLPFEGFRMRLVSMIEGLLDILERDEEYSCFVFDGQAIVVEDYLEVRPEDEQRLRRLIEQHRFVVGPWYTAVDTFLPDPESLVRNLQLGRWLTRRFGGREMPVGHLPDTFGFIGQMPQILRHFGYPDAFAWRGFHPEGEAAAFWWESPDGSRVMTMRPPGGYCEAARAVFAPEHFLREDLPDILAQQDREPYPYRLFVAGCDHFIANERLVWITQQIGERTGAPARIDSLETMGELIRASGAELPVVRGEQRDPCLSICPASVCGTRIPLKQANYRVETLLLGSAELLHALAELSGGGCDRAHLRWGWRLLAQNHPHDSIPGCSVDAVHREMDTRFARAAMVALDAAQRGAKRLGRALDPAGRGEIGAVGVVGLAGGRGRMRVRLHGPEEGVPAFRIVDTDGSEILYAVLRSGREHVHYHRLEDAFATSSRASYAHLLATRKWVEERRTLPITYELPFVDVEIELEAPRAGYRVLRLERDTAPGASVPEPGERRHTSRAEVENEHLRVWAGSHGLFVADKRAGRTHGPIYFSHAGEAGDEYTARPIPEPPVLFAPDPASAQVILDGLGEHLILPFAVEVPAELADGRRSRSGSTRLAGQIEIELVGDQANVTVDMINTAKDYDLRLIAHVPGARTARSGAPYGVEDRGEDLGHSHPKAPQQALPDFPFRGWVAGFTQEGDGLAVLARGLYEAAVRKLPDGVDLAPTLLRGVGCLSRGDLETRPGHAGPEIATPDAQCLGPQRWELALLPFAPGEADTLPLRAEQFLRPPQPFPIQWSAGHAPAAQNLFAGDDLLVVSALKPAGDEPGAVLHAYNPTTDARRGAVDGRRVRLDETPLAAGAEVGPFVVAAWKIEPGAIEG